MEKLTDPQTQSPPRRPGRPRAFDETEVMEQVMDLFWQRGFFQTSTREIAEATGLTLTSLSNAFGNKHKLFMRSLDLYIDQLRATALAPILHPDSDLEDIRAMFETAAGSVETGLFSRGCMVCNTALDLKALGNSEISDRITAVLGEIETGFAQALERAQRNGDVTQAVPARALAKHLLIVFHGLSTHARLGLGVDELKSEISVGLQLLRC